MASNIKGTVTVSLGDWREMEGQIEEAANERFVMSKVSEQLEIFLTFLAKEKVVYDAINSFNEQSQHARIRVIEGKVKIEIL